MLLIGAALAGLGVWYVWKTYAYSYGTDMSISGIAAVKVCKTSKEIRISVKPKYNSTFKTWYGNATNKMISGSSTSSKLKAGQTSSKYRTIYTSATYFDISFTITDSGGSSVHSNAKKISQISAC